MPSSWLRILMAESKEPARTWSTGSLELRCQSSVMLVPWVGGTKYASVEPTLTSPGFSSSSLRSSSSRSQSPPTSPDGTALSKQTRGTEIKKRKEKEKNEKRKTHAAPFSSSSRSSSPSHSPPTASRSWSLIREAVGCCSSFLEVLAAVGKAASNIPLDMFRRGQLVSAC